MSTRILCPRFPEWPLQRLCADRPELERRPIVLDSCDHRGRWVAVCSREAGRLGVRCRMPLAEALAVVGEGSLVIHPYDPVGDRGALERLAEEASRFSPVVGVAEGDAPDSLLLEISGVAHLFDGEQALTEEVGDYFRSLGYTCNLAVADTLGAAWALAHDPLLDDSPSRTTVATVAALRPLPVELLRLPVELVDVLHQLGLYRIGQLEPLDRDALAVRFGRELLRRWDQASGRLPEPVPTVAPPPRWEADISLDHAITQHAMIEAMLEQLVDRLIEPLLRADRGVLRLECHLTCEGAGPIDLSIGVFRPTASGKHLFELIRMRLERASLRAGVIGASASVVASEPLRHAPLALFDDAPRRDHPDALACLLDRLGSRLGPRSVLRARLRRDAQPERAFHYQPLLADGRRRRRRPASRSTTSHRKLPLRPLRLFRRPVSLRVVSRESDGAPILFRDQRGEHRVARVWGPERIETGWWRGQSIRRDYYRVRTTTGNRYWLFRGLRDGEWFLHGVFE